MKDRWQSYAPQREQEFKLWPGLASPSPRSWVAVVVASSAAGKGRPAQSKQARPHTNVLHRPHQPTNNQPTHMCGGGDQPSAISISLALVPHKAVIPFPARASSLGGHFRFSFPPRRSFRPNRPTASDQQPPRPLLTVPSALCPPWPAWPRLIEHWWSRFRYSVLSSRLFLSQTSPPTLPFFYLLSPTPFLSLLVCVCF